MRICWPNLALLLLIAVLGIGSMVTACGQKGDLYLPDQHPAADDNKPKKNEG